MGKTDLIYGTIMIVYGGISLYIVDKFNKYDAGHNWRSFMVSGAVFFILGLLIIVTQVISMF